MRVATGTTIFEWQYTSKSRRQVEAELEVELETFQLETMPAKRVVGEEHKPGMYWRLKK